MERKLDLALRVLSAIYAKELHMSVELDDLTAAVSAEDTVIGSAITLLNGISARIDAAIAAAQSGDKAALAALSADVKASSAKLSEAIAANTIGLSVEPGERQALTMSTWPRRAASANLTEPT